MHSIFTAVLRTVHSARIRFIKLWRRYRGLKMWQQIAIAVVLVALIVGLITLLNSGKKEDSTDQLRTVTLSSVGELSGTGGGVGVIGTVRSVTEANILAQTGGTVRSVNTSVGASVPAGFAIASLENASERASVLQAEGAYDAAIASRNAVSPKDSASEARNTYRNAFTALDTTLETQVDLFFGSATAVGPRLLINGDFNKLSRERKDIESLRSAWRANVATSDSRDPDTLLTEAETKLRQVSTFLNDLATEANKQDSNATATQLAGLASARATVNAQLAAVASARAGYRAGSTTSTASVDAGVKSALGSL
ncbi:MAG: hypothetical protein AAB883_01385, partial [Patescibacteria group bacterium]